MSRAIDSAVAIHHLNRQLSLSLALAYNGDGRGFIIVCFVQKGGLIRYMPRLLQAVIASGLLLQYATNSSLQTVRGSQRITSFSRE